MSVRILIGDVRARLKELPADSVDCVVTSPPYWGLRDYGTGKWQGGDADCDHRSPTMRDGRNEERAKLAGSAATNMAQNILAHNSACGKCGAIKVDTQLGLELTWQEHIATIADVFDEVRRVLKPTGTLWLNYGDSYATSVNGRSAADTKATGNDDRTFRDKPFSTVQGVLKPKDLCGIPWRVAFALQERGWWLRQDIIWSKPNPMPESITDRCTKAHEYIFLLTKAQRYYFDAEAIAEPTLWDRDNTKMPDGWDTGEGAHGSFHRQGRQKGAKAKRAKDVEASARSPDSRPHNLSDFEAKNGRTYDARNKRSVWTIATQPFSEAHFATFPPELVENCLKAGCPKGGTVLDPFGGAGTVGLVADRMGLDCTLIELNPAYVKIAENRIHDDAGMFAKVAAE